MLGAQLINTELKFKGIQNIIIIIIITRGAGGTAIVFTHCSSHAQAYRGVATMRRMYLAYLNVNFV